MRRNILTGLAISFGLCMSFMSQGTAQTQNGYPQFANTSDSDSVVHVAYKSVNKKDMPGGISVLNPSNYLDRAYGEYPLEGINAFIGGNNFWNIGTPLVLIDGVPRSIDDVTSNEIEQISFLKAANAVVLYGSRAANGVLLVTTKRGKQGISKKNIRINGGINVPKAYPDYLGSAEYMKYYNQASLNDGLPKMYADSTIQKYASHSNPYRYPDVDYFSSEYLRKMYNTYSGNAEFSSGSERARFYAIAGFSSQNSLLKFGEGKNEHNTRLNLRGNIDLKLNNFIKTYVNVSTVFSDQRNALGNYWKRADSIQPQRFAPLIPISLISKNSQDAQAIINGSRNVINGQYLLGGTQQYLTNPIADAYVGGYNTLTSRQFQYSNGLDVDLKSMLKGLSFHAQISVDYSNKYNESVNNTYAVYVPTWTATATADSVTKLATFNKDSRTGTQNLSNTWSDQLTDLSIHLDYVNSFKEKHNVSALLVANGLRRRQTNDFQNRTNTNLGIQLSYNYDHKYYADFSGSLVNSTRLPARKRSAFSPTASLGWLLSEENFLKRSDVVDRLKIEASAGIVNTDLDVSNYYLYNAVYSPSAYFSWSDGTYTNRATTISRGENPEMSYSKRKEVNLSVEGDLFKGNMNFLANAFFVKKDGIPVQNNSLYPSYFVTYYPPTSFVPYKNFEANQYRGVDFQLNVKGKAGDVKLIFGAAGSYITTKALKRDELYTDSYRNRAGKPTDAIFGLESEGLFADQAEINAHPAQKFGEVKPGDIKYKDQNQDGIIDDRDEVMIGRRISPFTGGLNVTAQWKNFTFFVLGSAYIGGTDIKRDNYYWVSGANKYSAVVHDSWTEETKNTATYPRLTTQSGGNNYRYSDFWAFSTDRVTVSTVQLTYAFSDKTLKNSFVKGLKIYASGNNLLTISKNRDIMELNIGSVPQTRFYNLGIKGEF